MVLSHPGTGPFVQHAARALQEAGLLAAYVTSFHYDRNSALGKFLRSAMGLVRSDAELQLSRRAITEVPLELVHSHPTPEIIRMAAVKGMDPITTDRVWEVTEKWFDRIVADRHVPGADAVYGYEHACLATFEAAKRQGARCIYEMPITHHATTADYLQEEFARFPSAQGARDVHLRRLAGRRNLRKDRELELSDMVVCNSSFTRESLVRAGIAKEKIIMVPLGAPAVWSGDEKRSAGPFVFLSAGTQSVRKGVHYLLDAWRRLGPWHDMELWLVGEMALPPELVADLPGTVVMRRSLPRPELFELYRRAGALVFPSLCEGFGMVITEAMSQGLPVITTANTAGPDFIEHGRSGFLVHIRDADRLAETMRWCFEHPGQMEEVSRAAKRAAARWQWSDYRAGLGRAVLDFLQQPKTTLER